VPLIEFPPAGVTDVLPSPYLRRLIRSGRVVGSFVAVQAIVQMIGFLSGILLIRMLEQREYAFFTIANDLNRLAWRETTRWPCRFNSCYTSRDRN
jgi:hypothetical protein